MKKNCLLLAALALPLCAVAQEMDHQEVPERLDSVVVSSARAHKNTPVTFSSLGRADLRKASPAASLPMSLDLLPSVVVYNEGGTGLGNSTMTVRGAKGSQINVTLNGITLNDAESQEVFWVNIPAFGALLSSVQLQRGLGTSASGAGAFGASLNMNTALVENRPSAFVEVGGGSYGTVLGTASATSGRLPSGLYFSLAGNLGRTNGYIRNAGVNAASLLAVLGWMKGNHSLRLTYLMGSQKSGITWDGIPPSIYETNPTYNPAGEYYDDDGKLCYYPNQTDNYAQHHLQLNYTVQFIPGLAWSNTLNYTRGDGFDEYYKTARKWAEFGFPFKELDGAKKSDMIYRKKSSGDLLAFTSDVRYNKGPVKAVGGVYLSGYDGLHWGEMVWAKGVGETYDYAALNKDYAWYRNQGKKLDVNVYARAEWEALSFLTAWLDLQYRHVGYTLQGRDEKASTQLMDYNQGWNFFNPRGGVTFHFGGHKAYASVALGNREPGRSDIKENIKGGYSAPIVPESMVDVEIGYGFTGERFSAQANVYLMEYDNILLETGRLSPSGYAIKENAGRGWRRGVELQAAWGLLPGRLRLDGNVSLSTNKLRSFTAYLENWADGGYVTETYENVDMLLSPSVIGMARVHFTPFVSGWWEQLYMDLSVKHVGKRYWDNTQNANRCIPASTVLDMQLGHSIPLRFGRLGIAFYVNNLLNLKYYASAWVYRAYNRGEYLEAGLYPQAPRNFMCKLSVSF